MELKEKLKEIMEREFGITSDTQLNKEYDSLDWSDFGIFTVGREKENAS